MNLGRRGWIIAGVVVAVLALGGPLLALATDPTKPEQKTPPLDLASASAGQFLKTYVDATGKVKVDNASTAKQAQAQGWALLIAAGAGDSQRYQQILSWTDANVATSDIDTGTAANIAWSLVSAGSRMSNADYTGQGNARSSDILTAKPDALSKTGVDNGLFFRGLNALKASANQVQLRSLVDNQRGSIQMEMTDRSDQLSPKYSTLPVSQDGSYNGDAFNVPLNLSTSCDASDANAAVFVWTKLRDSRDTRTASSLSPQGKVLDKSKSVRATVAAAAAAQAAGEQLQAYELLDDADGLRDQQKTMEASAWDALGRILVTTPWLGSCN